MDNLKTILASLFILLLGFTFNASAYSQIQLLPIQDGGRIKPFDSFSREYLELVYGKTKFEGRPAYEVILTWVLTPEAWGDKEIFEVQNLEVRGRLGLDPNKKRYTGEQIFSNPVFMDLMAELRDKRETQEKLTPYYQALQRLENQYVIFTEIASARMLRVLPPASTQEGEAPRSDLWVSVAELPEKYQNLFVGITKAFVGILGAEVQGKPKSELEALRKQLDEAVLQFQNEAQNEFPNAYANPTHMKVEVHFNEFHPFLWSAVAYGLSLVLFILAWIVGRNWLHTIGLGALSVGLLLHIYGFSLRVYLTGHPPVTNMYETVVWVAFGAVIFSIILTYFMKNRFLLLGGAMVATLCMIIADTAPVILNASIQPLEAVLRSNYWLTIHVLTITISYAAFFLALALGDIGLFYYLRSEKKYQSEIKTIAQSIYRSMQIGVAFLAPGIILGGIWADYSWGRFWGWDPKETWALIALLGYLAVLHGRLAGLIRDFGMIASGVATFSLVIMAWYGVNFVLGAGLHSYGFGAGGVEYVAGFVIVHFLLIAYTALVRREKKP